VRQSIVILEDNAERCAAMRRCLADKFPFFELEFFGAAHDAVAWLADHFDNVICLCLDHDLEPAPEEPAMNPGTGRDVADFIVPRVPRFPVVIHTSNLHSAIAMEADLEEAGWPVQRVTPYGDLIWIVEVWLPAVRNAVVQQAADAAQPAQGPTVWPRRS
jgi:hypothetical protein